MEQSIYKSINIIYNNFSCIDKQRHPITPKVRGLFLPQRLPSLKFYCYRILLSYIVINIVSMNNITGRSSLPIDNLTLGQWRTNHRQDYQEKENY
jgi:hypothetical protein